MSITYLEAIREAQCESPMADDPRVFIYGQDVGAFGGVVQGVTKNLANEYPGRVLDAPISEDAIVGAAIGAAMDGMRPIVEMQFADFSTPGLNQILNHAATMYWRTRVPCPITVRLPSGGTSGSGPFHSQSMEAIYAHYPGLIVMTPATVEDAYSMLLEAVTIDDPVIFCEHKYLYYHLKAPALPTEAMPVGKARIARPGRDLTIVAYSACMVRRGIGGGGRNGFRRRGNYEGGGFALGSNRSIPTQWWRRWRRCTGRLLCVGEAWPWGGVTAEVIAWWRRRGLIFLTHRRNGSTQSDTPIPYHPDLWSVHRPTARSIAEAARNVLRS